MFRPVKLVAIPALVVSALAACGTTVPQSTIAGGTNTGGGLTTGSTGGVAVPGSPTAGTTTGTSGSTGQAGGTGGATSGGIGSTGATGTTGTSGGQVRTTAPIKVGIAYTNLAAIGAAFGQKDASQVPPDTAKKFVDAINKQGGVAGRQIKAYFAHGDSASTSSENSQVVCSAFTEDTKVDVVVNIGLLGNELPSCLQQHGIAMLDGAEVFTDQADLQRHPNWLVPEAIRIDRSTVGLLESAYARGSLKRGDTVGVLREDCPWGPRIYQNAVVPEAKKLGIKLVEGTVKCVENILTDLGPISSDIQREELRFFSSGVTHVTVLSIAEAFMIAQFTQNASKQDYHPKYLVTSQAYPYNNSQSDAIIKISPDALPNFIGLGAIPLLDVGDHERPVNAGQVAARKWCLQVDPTMMGFKSTSGGARYFDFNTFYDMCDLWSVVRATLDASGGQTSIPAVVQGYRTALNGGLASALLAAGRFNVGSTRLDGVGSMRPFTYDAKQQHFEYVAPLFPVP